MEPKLTKSSTQSTQKTYKTWKRELAVFLLLFWGYCVLEIGNETVEAITPWVFIYVLGAFGLDAFGKQINKPKEGPKYVEDYK